MLIATSINGDKYEISKKQIVSIIPYGNGSAVTIDDGTVFECIEDVLEIQRRKDSV